MSSMSDYYCRCCYCYFAAIPCCCCFGFACMEPFGQFLKKKAVIIRLRDRQYGGDYRHGVQSPGRSMGRCSPWGRKKAGQSRRGRSAGGEISRRWILLRGQSPCGPEKSARGALDGPNRPELWLRNAKRMVAEGGRPVGEEGEFGDRRTYQQVIANNCTVLGPRCAKKD